MRNSKKLIAVIMTIAILASMMVPALAAVSYQTEADKLVEAGLMKGTGTSLDLESKLNRIQGIVFTIRAMGVEAAAAAMSEADITAALANVEDADKIPAWGRPHAAYAVKNNITNGVGGAAAGKIKFDSFAPLSGAQFTTMMLRALGYGSVTLANCFDKAQEVGMLTASKVVAFGTQAQLNRDAAAYIIYSTVMNGNTALTAGGTTPSAVKLINKLVEAKAVTTTVASLYFGYVAPTPAPAPALTVASITALNAKQVQVVFNNAVDKTTAETAANYTVGGTAFGTATLQADGKTVLLTLAGVTKMGNAANVEIKVLKAVKDSAGVALAADYTKTIAVSDSALPFVESIEATGSKTLKVTFSEPVWDNTTATTALETTNFTVKSGIYTFLVQTATADYAKRTVVLTLGAAMTSGSTITVNVNAAGLTNGGKALTDFAGLNLLTKEHTMTYAPNLSVAAVTLDSVNKTTGKAVVKFSKPVIGTSVNLYHSVKGVAQYGCTALTKATESVASDTWEFTFLYTLPSGALTFYLESADVAADQLTDLFGVKVPDTNFSFTVTADVVAPTVSTVTVNANTSVDIKFSEDIKATEATKSANFSILKPDGTALSFTPTLQASDTVRLSATFADNTTYTIKVNAMQDATGNAMAAVYSTTKTIGDNVAPSIGAAGTGYYAVGTDTIYIVFSEDMNTTDLAVKTNYMIDLTSGGTFAPLGADDTVTVVDSKTVKIVLKAGGIVAGGSDVRVANVRDLAGKVLSTEAGQFFKLLSNVPGDSLTYTVAATAKNKVKLTFSQPVVFDVADFSVTKAGAATTTRYYFTSIESNAVVDGKQEVVLVLENDLDTIATDKAVGDDAALHVTAKASPATKTAQGTKVTAGNVAITDKIAPEILKTMFINSTTIEVTVSEALDATFFAGAASANGFSVTGGTLTGSARTSATLITLSGTSFTADTDVAYNGTFGLRDSAVSANLLPASTRTDALTVFGIATATTVQTAASKTIAVAADGVAALKVTLKDGLNGAYGNGLQIAVVDDTAAANANKISAAYAAGVLTIKLDTNAAGGDLSLATFKSVVEAAGSFTVSYATGKDAVVLAVGDAFAAVNFAGGSDVVTLDMTKAYTAADVALGNANTDFALDNSGAVTLTATSVATDADTITVTVTAADKQIKGSSINIKVGAIRDIDLYNNTTVASTIN